MTAVPTPMNSPFAVDPPWSRHGRPSLGVGSTPASAAVLAVITFGLLPAVLWPCRWVGLLERERPFYRDLTTWWRRRVAPGDAVELDDVLARLRPRPLWVVLPWVTVLSATASLLHTASGYDFDLPRLLGATYTYHQGPRWVYAYPLHHSPGERLHTVWTWTLAFAYGCQWYAVRSHARAVGKLVAWTNRVAGENGFRRVPREAARVGLTPAWVIVALGFCWFHAWWAIPMVLAGAAQRRYADKGTPRLQSALSAQAGDAAAFAPPGGRSDARFCPAPHCGHRLPAQARFCSRCGSPTVAAGPHA